MPLDRRGEAAGGELATGSARPHDLRESFATWLEDAAIPSRTMDELMGHVGGRHNHGAAGSPMGRIYPETTPAMLARVTTALDDHIGRATAAGAHLLRVRRTSQAIAAERAWGGTEGI